MLEKRTRKDKCKVSKGWAAVGQAVSGEVPGGVLLPGLLCAQVLVFAPAEHELSLGVATPQRCIPTPWDASSTQGLFPLHLEGPQHLPLPLQGWLWWD